MSVRMIDDDPDWVPKKDKKILRNQEIEDALIYVYSYKYFSFSEYQKKINILYNYILCLEETIKNLSK